MSDQAPFTEFPSILQYDEAVWHRYFAVADPDLRNGRVEIIVETTQLGGREIPCAYPGGCAVVYRFQTASQQWKALRCFTLPLSDDIAERYALLGPYLREHAEAITTPFTYYPDGIKVPLPDDTLSAVAYPLLVMDWVAGSTLGEALQRCCAADDRAGIDRLYQAWIRLLYGLQRAHIAHGDLASGNILVGADDRLTLVDYDGCYIPDLAGRHAAINGQQDYQHPLLDVRAFDERMDDFSALLISTALLALRAEPALWDRFAGADEGTAASEHLLFMRQDLLRPEASPIFRAIAALPDPLLQRALAALRDACAQPPAAAPNPLSVLDPDFPARVALWTLERAVKANQIAAIVAAWTPLLERYPPAQYLRPRVERARQLSQFAPLWTALDTDDDAAIVAAVASVGDAALPDDTRERVTSARARLAWRDALRAALASGDDAAIAAAWAPGAAAGSGGDDGARRTEVALLTVAERGRALSALRRHQAQQEIASSLSAGAIEAALQSAHAAGVHHYDPALFQAACRFLAGQQPAGLRAWLANGQLHVRWHWPASPLIDMVALAWSAGDQAAQGGSLGSHLSSVTRGDSERAGSFQMPAAGAGPITVRICSALSWLATPSGSPMWRRLPEAVQGASVVARAPCHVRCRLVKRRWGSTRTLELRTADGSPLPTMVVVRSSGFLPLSPEEGVVVRRIDRGDGALDQVRWRFDVRDWPPRSVLRVFPEHQADSDWVRIDGEHGVRLDVN